MSVVGEISDSYTDLTNISHISSLTLSDTDWRLGRGQTPEVVFFSGAALYCVVFSITCQ